MHSLLKSQLQLLRYVLLVVLLCVGISACNLSNKSPTKSTVEDSDTQAFEPINETAQPSLPFLTENSPDSINQSVETETSFPIEIGESLNDLFWKMKQQGNHISGCYNFELFQYNEYYVLAESGAKNHVITDEIKGYAVFSGDHEMLERKGTLRWMIDLNDPTKLIGHSFDYVQAVYGPYHFDSASGAFIPGYITSKGYIIDLYLDHNNSVVSIRVTDFTREDKVVIQSRDDSPIDD